MSALLKIVALKKSFGTRQLLDVADLNLEAGKIYALTGDNGCGKSTLLRILAGLENADVLQGQFDNRIISGADYAAALRRDIVYVHQHPYLFNTSVAANIEYGLKMRGIAADTRHQTASDAIKWAGLQHVAHVAPKRLSGGEKQKVALARAKVLRPRLLLVDEPTANLDRAAREQIVSLLERTQQSQQTQQIQQAQQTAAADSFANNCVVVACHDREIIELPGVIRLHLESGKISH